MNGKVRIMATVQELQQELQQQLDEAKKLQQQLDDKRRKAQDLRWHEIVSNKDNFEWKVEPSVQCRHSTQEKVSGLRVFKRVKPEILDEWVKGGFPSFESGFQEPGRWYGMFYFRTEENILTYDGGGYCVLKEPKLCSDEQWESIKNGVIPDKFL